MVRISDARMSGTAYGTVVLHVAPEAAAGGPLALVHNGDGSHSTAPAAGSNCWWSDAELRRAWRRLAGTGEHGNIPGYYSLYVDARRLQADRGCDFDFLVGAAARRSSGNPH